jgi:Tol biopolymer transport system component
MWKRLPGWPFPQHRTIAAAGLIVLLLALQACGGSNGNYKRYGGPNGGGINNNATFTGKIIFVKNRNIFVLDGKTNSVTPLTFGNNTLQPSLSPDGKTLALEVRQQSNFYSDIATMPFQAGASPTLHTNNALLCHCDPDESGVYHYEFWADNPIWTSDGQNLIYLSDFFKGGRTTNPYYNQTCTGTAFKDYIQDLGIVQIQVDAQPIPAVASNGKTNPPKQLAWPYCSAGGDQDLSLRPGVPDTEVLFTSFQYTGIQLQLAAQISLLIIPNDGSPERIVQLSPLDPNTIPLEPSWSPDGKYITYIRRENQEDNLYIMPVPDTTITGTQNILPNGLPETYLLDQGGKTTYYTNTSYYDKSQKLADGMYGNPVWSPDGKSLLFMKFDTTDNGGTFNLFLAKLKFATPTAGPTASPTSATTAAPTNVTISLDGTQVQLTQGGIDGESRPIWVQ